MRLDSAVSATGIRLLATVLGVVFGVVIARYGGPSLKGFASAYMAANALCFALVNLDVPQTILREYRSRGKVVLRPLLAKAWAVYTVVAALVLLVCLVIGGTSVAWGVVGSALFGLSVQFGVLVNGLRGPSSLAVGALVQQAVLLAGALALVGLGRLSEVNVLLVVLSAYASAVLYYLRVWGPASRKAEEPSQQVSAIELFRRGVPWQPVRLSQAVLQRFDVLLVAAFVGVDAAGVYSVGLAMAALVTMLATQYSHKVVHDAVKERTASLRANIKPALISGVGGLFVLAAVGQYLVVALYGEAFQGAYQVMLVAGTGMILMNLAQVATNYQRLVGGPRAANIAHVSGAATFLAIGVLLTTHFGSLGAAFAYAVGCGVIALLSLLPQRRLGQTSSTREGHDEPG